MAKKQQTTQEFIPIQEVRDGVVILKNGGMRSVVLATSLNFALKSGDEQGAILSEFQNFVNSLDFSIQIFVQSKKLDIRPYLALLEDRYKEQTTDLMKIQVREYVEFVRSFVESTNIMTKSFFVVVPYDPPMLTASKNPISKILPGNKENAFWLLQFLINRLEYKGVIQSEKDDIKYIIKKLQDSPLTVRPF